MRCAVFDAHSSNVLEPLSLSLSLSLSLCVCVCVPGSLKCRTCRSHANASYNLQARKQHTYSCPISGLTGLSMGVPEAGLGIPKGSVKVAYLLEYVRQRLFCSSVQLMARVRLLYNCATNNASVLERNESEICCK